jgi:enoyl-[acyl-carrier-protein] reductase (NADH)
MLTNFYTKSMGKNRVRVNNVEPSYIKTNMTKNTYFYDYASGNRESNSFLGRCGQSLDLSNDNLFTYSDESKYFTGHDDYSDCGRTANGLIE